MLVFIRRTSLYIFGILLLIGATLRGLDILFPPLLGERVDYSQEILDANAVRLRLYTTSAGYWRLPVRSVDIDPQYIRFLLAYEDKRFYQHVGVDFMSLLRALTQLLTTGRFISGGSTITMQTIRLLQPSPRTLMAKIRELLRAIQLEYHLTKQQILDLYLTLAPYGGNIQGTRAASLLYFGKEPKILTLAEIALLVALPQAPEMRRPDRRPKNALAGRSAVLERLTAAGLISAEDATIAKTVVLPSRRLPIPRLAPHFADRMRMTYPHVQAIHTTIDAALQGRVENVVARYQDLQNTGTTLAVLIIKNSNCAIRAYVGSGGYFATKFPGQLDMIRAIRSPGSTLKPLVYGLAFDAGIVHPETLIFDRPGSVSGYAPGNFDRSYKGELTVREALSTSRNIPAIKILERLGTANLLQRLDAIGIRLHLPRSVVSPSLPIVLGGVGIRLQDLAQLYVSLANGGDHRPLRMLKQPAPTAQPTLQLGTVLLSPKAAWYITDILGQSQPPPGFMISTQRLAFKTGTSYGFRDAWAIGYDAEHTVGVWLGRPDNGYTADLSGLKSAVPVLLETFDLLPKIGIGPLLIQRPPGVLIVANAALPAKLQHFDIPPITPLMAVATTKALKIIYPPSGALVEVDASQNPSIRVEISNGVLPFYLLVNGRPIAEVADKHFLEWVPTESGTVTLTVLDRLGHSAKTVLQVRKIPTTTPVDNITSQ